MMKESYIKESMKISGVYFWLSLIIAVVGFTNNIFMTIVLYQIFNNTLHYSIYSYICIFLSLLGFRVLLGFMELFFEKRIRRKFCDFITLYFQSSIWKSNDKTLISSLISRDVLVLLDTISMMFKIFYYPICSVIGVVVIYNLLGLRGILAVSTVLVFIPLSALIAKKCVQLTNNIYTLSKSRLNEASSWIEWRNLLFNWGEGNLIFDRLKFILDKEILYRNLDSLWRCVDLYSITFGRSIPVITMITMSIVLREKLSNQLLLALWLSVPFISIIMEVGRFFSDYQMGKCAYAELKQSSRLSSSDAVNKIIIDDSWDIWDGSLIENLQQDKDNQHLELFKKLRLNDELILPGNSMDEISLIRFGGNISEGQKIRILLIRALHLAYRYQVPMQIERSLSSLDPELSKRLMTVLQDPVFKDLIIMSDSCRSFLDHQVLRCNTTEFTNNDATVVVRRQQIEKSNYHFNPKSLISDLIIFFTPLSLLFLLPAMGVSLLGYLAVEGVNLQLKLIGIIAISLSSIATVIYLGVKNENHTRQWAKLKVLDILKLANLGDAEDIYQRVSRDFATVVERISWYLHDITWFSSLLLVSVVATIISFGKIGLLIITVFVLCTYFLWRLFEKRIQTARQASITVVNTLLSVGENLICLNNLSMFPEIKAIYNRIISSNVDALYESNINLLSYKMIFSILIMCISGLFIAAALFGSACSYISLGALVFILTAILAVDSSFGVLFQALSGFNAQRISIHRLLKYPKMGNHRYTSLIKKQQDGFIFNGASNPNTNVKYLPTKFDLGKAYSLVGASGLGKSQFLKTISGLYLFDDYHDAKMIPALYVDKDASKIMHWVRFASTDGAKWSKDAFLAFVHEKIFQHKFNVIFIDEALTDFDLTTVNEILKDIQGYISQFNGLLIFVDHRFVLENVISISSLQTQ